jgi:flagellar hook assembly protein FlgD
VEIAVFDLMGCKVKSLEHSRQAAESHQPYWDGRDDAGEWVPDGCYFIRVEFGNVNRAQKVMLMK